MKGGVYIIPKTQAEINQCVSLLHSSGYDDVSVGTPARIGKRITVWRNIEVYKLDTLNNFDHREIKPNQLYEFLTKEL